MLKPELKLCFFWNCDVNYFNIVEKWQLSAFLLRNESHGLNSERVKVLSVISVSTKCFRIKI